MPESIALSLVSHTNVGKTSLARTLLGRDVGEVRDAPHVTEFADEQLLLRSSDGSELTLWDTPGFGDSVRLVKRLRQADNPLGWFLSSVWDRWRDRPFWASQQVLRHVRERSDVLLYLVNAAEQPAAAAYVAAEMDLLTWVGKPVLVLLNQLGPPRPAAAEDADRQAWVEHLRPWPLVRAVLPLDAFARCWVQEGALWRAVQSALPAERQATMAQLHATWTQERLAVFEAAMQTLADSLHVLVGLQEPLDDGGRTPGALRRLGAALGLGQGQVHQPDSALQAAEQRLAARIDAELRQSTNALLRLHGLAGEAGPVVLQRVAAQFEPRLMVAEGRAAWVGGLVSGALGGLAADLAAGGLTLGAGLLAGSLLGALGAAGAARGLNVVRGTHSSSVALGAGAWPALVQAAVLRYLAVAHFGRGRGDWADGEAPAHWVGVVDAVLHDERAPLQDHWAALQAPQGQAPSATAAPLAALLQRCTQAVLDRLYPAAGVAHGENRHP